MPTLPNQGKPGQLRIGGAGDWDWEWDPEDKAGEKSSPATEHARTYGK